MGENRNPIRDPHARTVIRFKVRGTGPFPVDMLRRDEAWPRSAEDARAITIDSTECWRGARTVELNAVCRRPNLERWASFGWHLVDAADDEGKRPARSAWEAVHAEEAVQAEVAE